MAELIAEGMIPLYRQVADRIQSDIINASDDPSRPIPSELMLQQRYGVSRITVRKAVMELVKEGSLTKIQGKGTFISRNKTVYPFDHGQGFTYSCQLRGVVPSTRVLNLDYVIPTEEDRLFFQLKEKEKVLMIQRLRLGDDNPCILETLFFPMTFSSLCEESLDVSLYSLLKEKYHIQPVKGHKWIEICKVTPFEAQMMQAQPGDAMLLMHEMVTDQFKKPLHTSKMIFSPSFRYYM